LVGIFYLIVKGWFRILQLPGSIAWGLNLRLLRNTFLLDLQLITMT